MPIPAAEIETLVIEARRIADECKARRSETDRHLDDIDRIRRENTAAEARLNEIRAAVVRKTGLDTVFDAINDLVLSGQP